MPTLSIVVPVYNEQQTVNDLLRTVLEHWPMAAAMAVGSYLAGSTPMGGGTVGFPVLVLMMDMPATLGRDFSFAIQAIGMTSASIYILCRRQELEWPMLRAALPGALLGTPLGIAFVAPLASDLFGYPTIYYLPPAQRIERVEFVRGGSGLLYGPQIGPTINFVTRRADAQADTSLYTDQGFGSDGLYSTYNEARWGDGDYGLMASFDHRQADGPRRNEDYEVTSGYFGFAFDGIEDGRIGFDLNLYESDSGEAGRLSSAEFAADRDLTKTPFNRVVIDRLIAAFDPVEGRAICVPVSHGKRGNPVLWPSRYFAEIRRLAGDRGARDLLGRYSDEISYVPVSDEGVNLDVDTPEALRSLGARSFLAIWSSAP